jgi:tRNA (cytidine32/uridine32-2'-O)-methyltransferase|tara:strand:+ start:2346 stop:3098 length:753 start_codon:yes stop_codon:yes gene_type:complete
MAHSELILKEDYDIEFILIETSHPGNIGACARAIKNMGFAKLGLVNPKNFPCDEAYHRSKGAKDILDEANIYKSLDEALSEATLVLGTSARERSIPWPSSYTHLIDEDMSNDIKDKNNKICILFGREDSGLSNDELQKCHMHLRIPCSDEYSSLNISHAVQIISYELRNLLMRKESIEVKSDVPLSTDADNEFLLEHLDKVLLELNFYDQNSSRQVQARLKRLIKKARPDKLEVGILRGFLTKIQEILNK